MVSIRANRATRVPRVSAGPIDVTLNWDEGLVSVLNFSQNEIDFRGLVDRPPLPEGRTVRMRFRPNELEGFEGVVISGGQVIRPAVEDGLLVFRVPDFADAASWVSGVNKHTHLHDR